MSASKEYRDKVFSGNVDILGNLLIGLPTSAPADGDIGTGQCVPWVDETGHTLNFKVKYHDGTTIKSGSIALT